MSEDLDYVKITASIFGGGLAGAFLTNLITLYRSRIQPVGKRIDVQTLFAPGFTGSTLRPTVSVSDGKTTYQFTNLHIADISVVNRGNRDFEIFEFGLTLAPSDHCVHVEQAASDRHHIVSIVPTITPADVSNTLDFKFTPFNRSDAYTFKLFIVAAGAEPGPVQFSSARPVRFIEMPSVAELAAIAGKIALDSSFRIGPFTVSLH
jgi:hypothetical protein